MDSIVGGKKYFHPSEILLGEELWDKLSGVENTMEEILKIINSISNVDFMKKYDYLVSFSNRDTEEYKQILREWNMFSDLELLRNDDVILEKIGEIRNLKRTYNRQIFRNGRYDYDRRDTLKNLVES
jgi:hypothetical protein